MASATRFQARPAGQGEPPHVPVTPKNKTAKSSSTQAAATPSTGGDPSALGEAADDDNDNDGEADGRVPSIGANALTAENLAVSNQWTGEGKTTGMFDLNDATFSSDEESDGEMEPDFEINDDDDYNAVDNISETSERSDAFEADVEREILAAGENNIDWDDENTYAFNDSMDTNQYSLLTGFDEPATPIERELFARSRRQSSARPANDTSHLSTFLKGTPLDEDWSSSSSSASDAGGDDAKENKPSATGQSEASSGDDETDDDAMLNETVHTPSVTLNRPTSRLVNRTPSVRSSIEGHAVDGRTPGKYGIMRKFKINPRKAVAFSAPDTTARGGRTIHFNAPKNRSLRWISAHTSRSSSTSSSRAPVFNFEDSRTGSIITDVINGRLFQQFNCNPQDNPSGHDRAEFARIANMSMRTYSRLAGGVFADLDEASIDDATHEQAMSFVDFQEDDDDDQDDDEDETETAASTSQVAMTPMLPPARPFTADDTIRASTAFGNRMNRNSTSAGGQEVPPSSPLAHVSRGQGKMAPELGAPFEPRHPEPGTPDSDEFSSRPTTAGQSSSPRKRRGTGEFDEASSLTPAMKKQRV
ncbi:hypothetical protein FH972_021942 [Carpinus fangiana]|uniref:Uncharacterized protein n=1 Tax=Carpinus fangiana TaxID=176857 RepID=A0A5N6KRB8_9ROSI|nr:hypothetical protein FH972_021942 [Carpinus fangiana]